jgi:signal transduction histidine kinase
MRDDIALESYLKAIVAESDRLAVWLRRLLDGVRPFEPRLAAIDVNGVVDAVVGSISARSDARGVSVSRLLATDLPAVQADDVHLQQALMGIIENAVDAVAPGGHVEVSTECTAAPAGIRIVVRDDGAGIAPERLASIFEPFVTTKREGTGLGLAIARKVVERHGGRIMIASQPGLGTTVTVALPSDGQPARLRA